MSTPSNGQDAGGTPATGGRHTPTRDGLRRDGCAAGARNTDLEGSATTSSRGRHGAWTSSSNSSTAC